MIDKNSPALARVQIFGHPWHGLVRGGQLALPNGQNKLYPQPAFTLTTARTRNFARDDAGRTLLQRLDGVQPIVRSAEELAADEAAGREWRETAILAGRDLQLHGMAARGWCYQAPDLSRWHISQGCVSVAGAGAVANITARGFGYFGRADVAHTVSAALSSTGQATPVLDTPALQVALMDILPTGRSAIFMIWAGGNDGFNTIYKYALGFLRLDLTGTPGDDFAASLTVLADRATALGQWQSQDNTVYQTVALPKLTVQTEIVDLGAQQYQSISHSEVGSDPVLTENVAMGSNNNWSITGRIVAMWFDAAGLVVPVTLSATWQQDLERSPNSLTADGEQVVTYTYTGSAPPGDTRQAIDVSDNRTTLRTARSLELCSYTLSVSAGAFTESVSASSSSEHVLTYSTAESSVIVEGTVQTVLEQSESNTISESITSEGVSATESFQADYVPRVPSVLLGAALDADDAYRLSDVNTRSAASAIVVLLSCRWANNLFGVAVDFDPQGADSYIYRGAVHPGGIAPGATYSTPRYFGSWNPHTNEALIAQQDPVCWV